MIIFTCRYFFFLSAFFIAGVNSGYFFGTLSDKAVKYVCTNGTAILPWRVVVETGEEIVDIQWGKVHQGSDQLIAMYAHSTFLPLQHYSGRCTFLPNAGLTLHNVTPADSAQYYVQVTGRHSDGGLFSMRQQASLTVIDSIVTSTKLEVRQQSVAVFNTANNQWSVDLTCGTFFYTGHTAPLDVLWTDPAGQVMSSSFYDNGTFHLLLAGPLLTQGNYTCRLPIDVIGCHQGAASSNASVQVDSLVARVTVLEAQNGQLLKENSDLKVNVTDAVRNKTSLKQTMADLQESHDNLTQLTDTFRQQVDSLHRQNNATSAILTDLAQRVQQLQSHLNQPSGTGLPPSGDPVLEHVGLDQVQTSLAQCNQRANDLAAQFAHSSEQDKELLTTQLHLAQQLNETTLRQTSDMTSLNASIQHNLLRFISVRRQMRALEMRLEQGQARDSVLSQEMGNLETVMNSTQRLLGDNQTLWNHPNGDHLRHQIQDVQNQLNDLTIRWRDADVSFHVRMDNASDNVSPSPGQPVVLSHVISNRGNAYSGLTGKFVAPLNATYLFLATLAPRSRGYYAELYLMQDNLPVDFVETYGESNHTSGAAHAVLQLHQGSTVWLRSHSASHFNASCTAFSGALLTLDP